MLNETFVMNGILKDKLYTIVNSSVGDEKAVFDLSLNADDEIYRVHFPGNPITPGACLIQIAKELASVSAGRDMDIEVIKNIKFVAPVIPSATPEITYSADRNSSENSREHWKINVHHGETVFAKLSLIFR